MCQYYKEYFYDIKLQEHVYIKGVKHDRRLWTSKKSAVSLLKQIKYEKLCDLEFEIKKLQEKYKEIKDEKVKFSSYIH